jgi:predicted RNA-binding protein with PUA-like domain
MVCDQGSTFSLIFTIKTDGTPWNLVGNYTARMQVRSFLNADTVLIELTTANSRISFSAGGTVTLSLTSTDTTALPAGRHTYDLEFEDGAGTVTRVLEGKFVVRGEVTR